MIEVAIELNVYFKKMFLSCPSKNNSNTIELTVHTSCYWGLRLTLCYALCSESGDQVYESSPLPLSFEWFDRMVLTGYNDSNTERVNHLTESTWPNEYDRKICTWPKRSHRRTWTMELDRKCITTTNINGWIWPKLKNFINSVIFNHSCLSS